MDKTAKENTKLPRIDVHVHMVSARQDLGAYIKADALNDPFTKALMNFKINLPGISKKQKLKFDDWYVGKLAAKVRASKHIDKVVLMAFDEIYTPDGKRDEAATKVYVPNDAVFEAVKKYPDVLLAGASVNPYRPDALEELERCAERGAVMNKWVANSQQIDPGDARIAKFYDKMAELKLVLLSHTGYEHAVYVYDQSMGDPRRLVLPLDRGVTVIAGHAGASGSDDPIEYFGFYLEMLKKHPNLYGDLAALTWTNRKYYLMHMTREPELFDRMVQGTDYPVPVFPTFFAHELGLGRTLSWQFNNYFDVEAKIKLALGVPESVFTRAAELLPLKN